MIEFVKNNKLVIILILIIIVLVAYQFLFMTKEKAAFIVYEHSSGVKWDTGYLIRRAKAIKRKKSSFKYKGEEYSSDTGKKIV